LVARDAGRLGKRCGKANHAVLRAIAPPAPLFAHYGQTP
jgi:hypothetical protein